MFVAGFLTDQCIDHVVKDGADRGCYMTCVHDSCAAETEARHRRGAAMLARAIAGCSRPTMFAARARRPIDLGVTGAEVRRIERGDDGQAQSACGEDRPREKSGRTIP